MARYVRSQDVPGGKPPSLVVLSFPSTAAGALRFVFGRLAAATRIGCRRRITELGSRQLISEPKDGLVRRVLHFGGCLHSVCHVLPGDAQAQRLRVVMLETRLAVGRDGSPDGDQLRDCRRKQRCLAGTQTNGFGQL